MKPRNLYRAKRFGPHVLDSYRSKIGTLAYNRAFEMRDARDYGVSSTVINGLVHRGFLRKYAGHPASYYPTAEGWRWIEGEVQIARDNPIAALAPLALFNPLPADEQIAFGIGGTMFATTVGLAGGRIVGGDWSNSTMFGGAVAGAGAGAAIGVLTALASPKFRTFGLTMAVAAGVTAASVWGYAAHTGVWGVANP